MNKVESLREGSFTDGMVSLMYWNYEEHGITEMPRLRNEYIRTAEWYPLQSTAHREQK